MKVILEKLKSMVYTLENEHGPMLIFALFQREHPFQKWDILLSATWLHSDDWSCYELVDAKLQEVLTLPEKMRFARFVILDSNEPEVAFLQDATSVTNGLYKEVSSEPFTERFGFTIMRAYFLRCQKLEDLTEKKLQDETLDGEKGS